LNPNARPLLREKRGGGQTNDTRNKNPFGGKVGGGKKP